MSDGCDIAENVVTPPRWRTLALIESAVGATLAVIAALCAYMIAYELVAGVPESKRFDFTFRAWIAGGYALSGAFYGLWYLASMWRCVLDGKLPAAVYPAIRVTRWRIATRLTLLPYALPICSLTLPASHRILDDATDNFDDMLALCIASFVFHLIAFQFLILTLAAFGLNSKLIMRVWDNRGLISAILPLLLLAVAFVR